MQLMNKHEALRLGVERQAQDEAHTVFICDDGDKSASTVWQRCGELSYLTGWSGGSLADAIAWAMDDDGQGHGCTVIVHRPDLGDQVELYTYDSLPEPVDQFDGAAAVVV